MRGNHPLKVPMAALVALLSPIVGSGAAGIAVAPLLLLSGCGDDVADTPPPPPPRVAPEPLLVFGGAVPDGAVLFTILDVALQNPGDLAFNPDAPEQLWVTSQDDHALAVVTNPGAEELDGYKTKSLGEHFLHEVIAIAFGDSGTFGTCGESRNEANGDGNDFMGPVLWPSDKDLYPPQGQSCDGVHLDMLHDSPWCMGIAAETGNAYYVFNGLAGVIDWYDFQDPHEPGGEDHSDGLKRRYQDMGLEREPGVPSNLVLDGSWLYIADSGNGRVLRLDTASGTESGSIPHYEDEEPLMVIKGAVVEEVIPASSGLVEVPSGLALFGGLLYVSDFATGFLHAVTLAGEPVNQLDTGLGPDTLAGITVGPDERLYLVDRKGDRVLRVDRPETCVDGVHTAYAAEGACSTGSCTYNTEVTDCAAISLICDVGAGCIPGSEDEDETP